MPCPEDEAHIFLVSTDTFTQPCLSPDEQERAARFRFAEHRETFSAARSALRTILGRYLECDPHAIQFGAGAHGKPYIDQPASAPPVHFNLSHSHRSAVIAVTGAGPIGIDMEHIRLNVAHDEIARRYFSPKEQEWLESRPENERKRDFFRLWVLKEALIKADGRGLSMTLAAAEIGFMDNCPRVAAGNWWVQELELVENFTAAIACSRQCRLLIMDS